MSFPSAEDEFLLECVKFANENHLDNFSEVITTSFKPVNADQVHILESHGNISSDWSKVLVEEADSVTLNRIRRCTFSGFIIISLLTGAIDEIDGAVLPSGLFDTFFAGKCFISRSCRISSTSIVSNVFLGFGAGIINCGSVTCDIPICESMSITVGPETGGRSVRVSAGMNFVTICEQIFRGKASVGVSDNGKGLQTNYSVIGNCTTIFKCDKVRNSYIGPKCRISSSNLDCCTLSSSAANPIVVSAGARLSHCIMNESTSACNGCLAEFLYMSENSSIGDCARISHCVLGPDSSVAGGECHSSLLGPFVGFHHQSLLIASVWPQGRGNIAYGAKIGANHTGRVSDQECFPGEGIFFGLGSSIKFPSNLLESPYSIVAPGTVLPPQRLSFPFSLISICDRHLTKSSSANTLSPGWVIASNPYLIERASKKYSSRRKAKSHRTDVPLLRPWLMDCVRSAFHRLETASSHTAEEGIHYNMAGAGLCVVTSKDALKGLHAYSDLLKRYSLLGLLYLLLRVKGSSQQDRVSFLQDLLNSLLLPVSDESSQWELLMIDLQQLTPLEDSEAAKPYQMHYMIAESSNIAVLTHQLRMLSVEDADKNALLLPTDLLNMLQEWSSCGTEPHLLESFRSTVLLLSKLCVLENTHALRVKSCRERDGVKGREVIPDYDAVNAAGGDCLSDPIVKYAIERSTDIDYAVTQLQHTA